MSNNTCSLQNGERSDCHPMSSVTSSAFSTSSLAKQLNSYSNGNTSSNILANIGLGSHTAFPFPPSPMFLSSLLHPPSTVAQSWFTSPPQISAPLSLTVSDSKESAIKNDKSYRDSPQDLVKSQDRTVGENILSDNVCDKTEQKERNARHSDNLSWLADVAISSRSLPSSGAPSQSSIPLQLNHNSSPRDLYHSSLMSDIANGQRLYSPRFTSNGSPLFHYQTGGGVGPPAAHFTPPFISSYSPYQQFSPTAQNSISPFIVPNASNVASTRSAYPTGILDSYSNHNHHNAILNSAAVSSMSSQSCISSNNCRSPSNSHSSDSPSMFSAGPFSSPPNNLDSPSEATKSAMRFSKDSHNSQTDELSETAVPAVAVKRKSLTSNETESNYKIPCGREGSRKHRILKPPNISIIESNNGNSVDCSAAPLSAPPIPGMRREFANKINSNSNTFCEPICLNNNIQRRKSVPQTTPQKCLTNALKENSLPHKEYSHLQYPIYFRKGSIIQLGNGKVKPVEEMSTEDFLDSATQSADLCADSSEVVKIEDKIRSFSVLLSFIVGRTKVPVTVEAPVEHPFFVFHRGWSSYLPERSLQRYGLKCHKLKVGDVCVSLTPKSAQLCPTSLSIKSESIEINNNKEIIDLNLKKECESKPNEDTVRMSETDKNSVKSGENDVAVDKSVPINSEKRNRRHSAPDAIAFDIKAS